MPKITCTVDDLEHLLGFPVPPEDLAERLWCTKTWLRAAEPDRLVLEQVDTNRPDLWSVEGICREIRAVAGTAVEYGFLSDPATVRLHVSGPAPWPGSVAMVLLEVTDLDPLTWRTAAQTAAQLTEWYGRWAEGFTIGRLVPDPGAFVAPIDVSGWPVLRIGDTRTTIADLTTDDESKAAFIVAGPLARNVRTAAAILGANLSDRGGHVNGCAATMPLRPETAIPFDADDVNRVLGTTFTDANVVATLRRLGHEIHGVPGRRHAIPPAWRDDVLHPVDLAEDLMLARGGPVTVPRTRPAGSVSAPIATLNLLAERVAEKLVARGYAECLSNVLRPADVDNDVFGAVGRPVQVSNPVTPAYAALRTSLLPGLLDAAASGVRRPGGIRVFELGETLLIDEDSAVRTHWTVGAVSAAGHGSLTELHAALLSLADLLGVDLVPVAAAVPWAGPLESAEVRLGDTTIGWLGALSADIADRRGMPPGTACLELRLDPLG